MFALPLAPHPENALAPCFRVQTVVPLPGFEYGPGAAAVCGSFALSLQIHGFPRFAYLKICGCFRTWRCVFLDPDGLERPAEVLVIESKPVARTTESTSRLVGMTLFRVMPTQKVGDSRHPHTMLSKAGVAWTLVGAGCTVGAQARGGLLALVRLRAV